TVSTKPQPLSTACSTLGARSVSPVETSTLAEIEYFFSASCSPAQLDSLKERSCSPPEFVTMRAQKVDALESGASAGAEAQPERASSVTPMRAMGRSAENEAILRT